MTSLLQSDRESLLKYFSHPKEVDILLQLKYHLTPDEFEQRVAQYYQIVQGYTCIVQGWYDDECIDVIATKAWSPTLYIQCKKYIKGHIQLKDVAYFYGMVTDKTTDDIQMVYIATTRYTPNAKKFARQKNITLLWYREVVDMAKEFDRTSNKSTNIQDIVDDQIFPTDLVDREWPQIHILQQDINTLQDVIAREKTLYQSLQQSLYLFNIEYKATLAPYFLEKLTIDNQITKIITKLRELSDTSLLEDMDYDPIETSDEDIAKEEEYYQQQQAQQKIITTQEKNLSDDDKVLIKKLYKELMMKFHPDRYWFDSELQKRATALTQEINEAYRNSDLAKLRSLQEQYKNGFDDYESKSLVQIPLQDLISCKERLENMILDIEFDYKRLRNNELYIMYQQYIIYQNQGKNFFDILIKEIQEEILIAKDVLANAQLELDEKGI